MTNESILRQSASETPGGWRLARIAASVALFAWLAACSVEPTYKAPDAGVPAAYKETPQQTQSANPHDVGTWTPAQPADDAHRGEWWTVFGDPTLDKLEQQAFDANQDLKAAAARVQQARAVTQAARASWFPSIDAGFGPTYERASPASQYQPQNYNVPAQTLWRAQATASYEVDLFGRVSSNVHATQADAQQSEALFRSVQLALQADVAQNYFQLRQFDSDVDLYRRTVTLRADALKLVERRFKEGDISALDVAQARNELASARADAVGVARQRAASEHSLAILLGKAPADFTFPETPLAPVLVQVPPGLPSTLLERPPRHCRRRARDGGRERACGPCEVGVLPETRHHGGVRL